jgi:SAM-dependent methyltransferase
LFGSNDVWCGTAAEEEDAGSVRLVVWEQAEQARRGKPMSDNVQTWHYGLMARHWAETMTSGPEIEFYQRQIERYGQPALDAGCGTGRLLVPFLRAGLDVDGCDVSADMLAYCRQAAQEAGTAPNLYRQALHELDLPRHYRTIVACGAVGIGVSREQDFLALQRFYHHLLPGGMLILDHEVPYAGAHTWPHWRKDARADLPESWPPTIDQPPADGRDYALHYRLVAVDPLAQQTTGEMRMLLFRDGQPAADDTLTLTENHYFRHELQLLLEKAGFAVEAVKGDWTDAGATAEHDTLVYFARK